MRDLCFDNSGTYLAVAGSDIRVYLCKQWQDLKVFNDHTGKIFDLFDSTTEVLYLKFEI